MSEIYVPWRNRPTQPRTGLAAHTANVAQRIALVATPVLRRFPGLIFATGVVASCLAAWIAALLVQQAWEIQTHVVPVLRVAPENTLSIAQIRQIMDERGIGGSALVQWPLQFSLVRDLIGLTGVVAFASVLVLFSIWWERKVSAFIHSRLGPMRVGGWNGWAQTIADGIKLVAKEDLIPAGADRPLFRLAPYLAMVPAICGFIALPFGLFWVMRELDVALLLILALLGIEILGVLIAGWASNNKWSVYGAMREACQVVSYEIPMGLSLLIPIMIVGSLRMTDIAAAQAGGWTNWLAWHSPWAFAAMGSYFVASLAACKRAPFDLPEAESELVAGFHTEYSGFRWSVFFFAEYCAMFIVSGVLTILFLGGWDSPWAGLAPAGWAESTALSTQLLYGVLFGGPLWFVFKCMFLVTVQMWLRWTLPRLRIDQVLYSCMQVVLPLTLVLVVASAAWELAVRDSPGFAQAAGVIRYVLAFVGAIVTIGMFVVAAAGFRRGRELVGPFAVDRPLPGG